MLIPETRAVRDPKPAIELRTSELGPQPSPSRIPHRVSSIEHRPSRIAQPTTSLRLSAFCLLPSACLRALSLLIFFALLTTGCQHRLTHYPVGIYSVNDTNALATVHRAGFNTVVGPANRVFLDSADDLGVKVFASPGTSAGKNFNASAARRTIAAFDRHPALWAWYLVDEPDLHRIPPDDVRRANRFIKSVGAHKPTGLVLFQGYESLDYGNIADILMIDRYPIPWLPLANFPQHVRMARLSRGRDKPLIAIIQAFDWSLYPDLLPGEENLRPPTYDELRAMAYSALVYGANGLLFYAYADSRWKMEDHPDTWDALKRVVAEVNERLPLFAGKNVWWPFDHDYGNPATRFNEALQSSVAPALIAVRHGTTAVPAGDYIVAVNTTTNTHLYEITVPRKGLETVPVLGEARSIPVVESRLEDTFEPYSIHIYGPLPKEGLRIRKEKGIVEKAYRPVNFGNAPKSSASFPPHQNKP